ncbi:unnamed protein product [Rhizophagus irregularis]|nr:unnamed protein product [Rhizophagus irregularis]CAB4446855.1 unnamed protein product [Rhizophagus irregularis]
MAKNDNIDNPNEWVENAISKKLIKYYEYKHFNNIKEIATANEIIETLKLRSEADFHDSVIHFFGVTSENDQNNLSKNYSLVMEYADGGTLRKYLRKNFDKITCDDKLSMAYQLVCAVSCLHNEGIVHSDLHSNNILVNQNIVKLANFGLSKSGRPPFYTEDEQYDISLIYEITQGLREKPIPDTSIAYINLYTDCWNEEPDNRPTMSEVVDRLKDIIFPNDETTKIDQTGDDDLVIINIDKSEFSSAGGLDRKR